MMPATGRSSMFFQADVLSAADEAANSLERHGLDPEEVTELAAHIHTAIEDFFSARDSE